MLAELRPDGAVIAVPHNLHAPLAIPLARAGVHLLVEKPMVLDPAEGVALLAAAEASGTEVLVGYPWHYNVQAIALRSAIAGGRIGTIELVTCTYGSTVRDYYRGDTEAYADEYGYERVPGSSTYADPAIAGGGQGQTQLTHAAALLLFLTGLRPRRVTAEVEDFELQVDLADALAVRFEGGAIGTLASTGGVARGHEEALEYRIFGDAGHVGYDVMQGRAWIAEPQGALERLDVLEPELRYPQLEPLRNLVDVDRRHGTEPQPRRPRAGRRRAHRRHVPVGERRRASPSALAGQVVLVTPSGSRWRTSACCRSSSSGPARGPPCSSPTSAPT